MNATTESFADFLCMEFGMSRESEKCENLVLLTLHELTGLVKDLHSIDEQVDKSLYKLKSERLSRIKTKRIFKKKMSMCKRNYPGALFPRFCKCVSSVVTTMNDSYFVKSPTLIRLEKEITLMCDRRKEAMKEPGSVRVKRKSCSSNTVRRMYDSKAVDRNMCNTRADDRVFPVWHKENPDIIKVVSTDGKNERTVEVYKPSYFPNPFSDFMQRI